MNNRDLNAVDLVWILPVLGFVIFIAACLADGNIKQEETRTLVIHFENTQIDTVSITSIEEPILKRISDNRAQDITGIVADGEILYYNVNYFEIIK